MTDMNTQQKSSTFISNYVFQVVLSLGLFFSYAIVAAVIIQYFG